MFAIALIVNIIIITMKYEEIVQQFKSNVFGTLTTIRTKKEDGKIWFIGKEIQEFLGLTNITQAIKDAN